MAEPTYRIVRIVKRKKPKRVKKDFVCPACHGIVKPNGRQSPESVREVHENTCPARRA